MKLEQGVEQIRFLHHENRLDIQDPLWNHAVDEGIGHGVAAGMAPPTLRVWRYHQAFMLGRRDERLPGFAEATRWACKRGYDVAVRPSGGTCVILDQGVLNLSLILPMGEGCPLTIRDGFEALAELIVSSLKPWHRIETGEVKGSYCPGDFDLSISGFKFSGIAQRRMAGAAVIQAFLLVEGSGEEHLMMIREWYQRAGLYQVDHKQRPLPYIQQGTIRCLNEHQLQPIGMEDLIRRLSSTLKEEGIQVIDGDLSEEEKRWTLRERQRFTQVLQLPSYLR